MEGAGQTITARIAEGAEAQLESNQTLGPLERRRHYNQVIFTDGNVRMRQTRPFAGQQGQTGQT